MTAFPAPDDGAVLLARGDGRTWVKICGISDPEDAAAAVAADADALGVVFHPASPRHVTRAQAADVVVAAGRVPVVAVIVDAGLEELVDLVGTTGVKALQLHGEGAAEVAEVRAALPNVAVVVARALDPNDDAWPAFSACGADAILLDASVGGREGGTGATLKWQRPRADAPVILAGGLDPENVGAAISAVAPFGVDVSSGVESAPGVKDPARIRAFLDAVRSAP